MAVCATCRCVLVPWLHITEVILQNTVDARCLLIALKAVILFHSSPYFVMCITFTKLCWEICLCAWVEQMLWWQKAVVVLVASQIFFYPGKFFSRQFFFLSWQILTRGCINTSCCRYVCVCMHMHFYLACVLFPTVIIRFGGGCRGVQPSNGSWPWHKDCSLCQRNGRYHRDIG